MAYSTAMSQVLESILKSDSSSDVFAAFLIGSLVLLFAIFLKYAIRRHTMSKYFPCKSKGFFSILGNAEDIFKMKEDLTVGIMKVIGIYADLFKSEQYFCFWVSFKPLMFIIKADGVEELIGGTKNLKKGFNYNFLHTWLGTGLLTSDGKKWKSRRRLLTPSFHFEILKDFLPVFNEQSQKLIKILQKETTKDFTDIVMPVTLCSLDIICETTLGVSVGAQENEDSEYVRAVSRAAHVVVERTITTSYWLNAIFRLTSTGRQNKKDIKLLHNFTDSVIREKKEKLLNGDMKYILDKKKRKALLDVLLEHHIQTKDLSEADIREEVDTFTFEGHDTTSMGISWALYLIGLYKDVQEKLHEEIDRIFGDDTERPVDTDDLKDMPYLDRVLKESHRLYPSVPFIVRETTEDITICGYNIPKYIQCVVAVHFLHRDENVFRNPEKFDPDRFLPENSAKRHPFAYIPFSAGSRNCIGQRFAIMEEKVVVINILRNFTLKSLDSRDKVQPAAKLTLRAATPIRIKISPRKKFIFDDYSFF